MNLQSVKISFLLVVIFLIFTIIVGCGGADPVDLTDNQVDGDNGKTNGADIGLNERDEIRLSEVELSETIHEIDYAGAFIAFTGNISIVESLEEIDPEIEVINIELLLFSEDASGCLFTDTVYNDTCPPMPVRMHPFSMYQITTNRYLFLISNTENNDKIIFQLDFEPDKWQKINLVLDLNDDELLLIVNDTPYKYIEGVSFDVGVIEEVMLGKGILDRYWSGKIAYFKVFDDKNNVYVNVTP
jgi:hypothetical protein